MLPRCYGTDLGIKYASEGVRGKNLVIENRVASGVSKMLDNYLAGCKK